MKEASLRHNGLNTICFKFAPYDSRKSLVAAEWPSVPTCHEQEPESISKWTASSKWTIHTNIMLFNLYC